MLKNYFKTAIRSLLRNKGYSLLNILGLSIGMASTILIVLWIYNEVSMDRFHEKIDRLYILNNRDKFSGELWAWNTTPKVLGPTMKRELPEIENMTRFSGYANFLFTVGDNKLTESGAYADSTFLDVFTYPLVKGNPKDALSGVNKIVVTEKFAKKLFGDVDPMGKTVKLDSNTIFTVSGILKDLPTNTTQKFSYIIPWTYMKKIGEDDEYWGNNSVQTYVLLKPNVGLAEFNNKIQNFAIDHTKGSNNNVTAHNFAYPLSQMYLYGKSVNGQYVAGNIVTVRMFAIIAALILLIACINFMNLSTARSERRAKEVGVRKVVGARKGALVLQFLIESIVIAILAFLIALIMVVIVLPFFNTLVGKQLSVPLGNGMFWLSSLLFILLTGMLAGSYPAFFLSSFSPVKVLKGTFRKAQSKFNPRSILVVIQFTFAIVLIISTIVIATQIHHIQQRDRGYNQDALVYSTMSGDISKNYELIRQELLNSGVATSVTKTMSPVTQIYSDGWGYSWPGSTSEDDKLDFKRFSADANLAKTIGGKIIQGRDIDIYTYPTDSLSLLLNESAVKAMHLTNPIGTTVKNDGKNMQVVGVIKDFVIESPTSKVGPMIILGPNAWFNTIHYRLNPAHSTVENLKKIESIFKKYNTAYPFEYTFADEGYAQKFVSIQRTVRLTTLFSGLTIFISCLGLFGLAAYMAEARTKEVGVRKVLGASISNIAALLSKDFLKLVLIALLVSVPIAWYAMHQWLADYEYKISMPISAFVLAGVLSIAIALFTVGFLALRAAKANPTKSLRSE